MTAYTATLTDTVGFDSSLAFQVGPVVVDIFSILKPDTIYDPSFSPDGTAIIFVQHSRAPYRIVTVGTGATVISEIIKSSLYPLGNPTYSADGLFILYSEQTTLPSVDFPYGQSRLKYMHADGTHEETILDDGAANLNPVWITPTQIAFQWWMDGATPSTSFEISLIDLAGRGRVDLGEGEYPRLVEL